jgi:hypothetical protein
MGTSQINLNYPVSNLGDHKEWNGQQEHATYVSLLESYMTNTGYLMMDDKEGGK